jgi:hypothetical protein
MNMTDHPEIDRWLDEALADYAHVEPRPGLENRMLARLASETRAPRFHRWAFVVSLAALPLLLLWIRPALETVPAPQVPRTERVPSQAGSPDARRGPRDEGRAAIERVTQAKREHFPTPSPLSEQEKMLIRFVRDFPKRAALVAQVQMELNQQDQKEMARPWPAKENN